MRLLNTKTLQLELFIGKPPPYSILSHCWGEEEVSFQDLNGGNHEKLKGYAKIAGCCRVSRLEGYDYTWIDTCCIDKTSSAELSEAINSMFNWYMQAAICYAYLVDVDDVSSLVKSRWFTRGWTLQELIAPPAVILLSSSWREIGTRSTLADAISSVTGIEKPLLRSTFLTWTTGYDIRVLLRQYSIACKMSWAAKRTTTRVEDMAYCLMGLFDVNMSLIYGEGEKAFYRLQCELLNESDDSSIFAWSLLDGQSPDRDTGLLAASPRYFADSGDILYQGRGQPKHQGSVGAIELSKSNIRLCAPILLSQDYPFTKSLSPLQSPLRVSFRFKSALKGDDWGEAVTWDCEKLGEWTQLVDKPKVLFRENVLASIVTAARVGADAPRPLAGVPPADIFVAVLDCSTSHGAVGLLLKRDSRGVTTRRHSTTILRFMDPTYWVSPVQTLSIPARVVESGVDYKDLAQRATDEALNVATAIKTKLCTRLDDAWYSLARQQCMTALYRPSTPLEELQHTVPGAWKFLVFEHFESPQWRSFYVFYEYVSEAEIKIGCGLVPDTGASLEWVESLRAEGKMQSNTSVSEVRVSLGLLHTAILKVRERKWGSRELVVLVEGPSMWDCYKPRAGVVATSG